MLSMKEQQQVGPSAIQSNSLLMIKVFKQMEI